MKRILVTLLITITSLSSYSQDYKDKDFSYYDGIENHKELKITPEQKERIIKIKKTIGKRHTEIGRDRSLFGYEKGKAHRKLNLQIRKEINNVLSSDQIEQWENNRESHKKESERIRSQKESVDDRINRLDEYYEDLIDHIEDNTSLTEEEKKIQKKEMKKELKSKKEMLKKEKEALKKIAIL